MLRKLLIALGVVIGVLLAAGFVVGSVAWGRIRALADQAEAVKVAVADLDTAYPFPTPRANAPVDEQRFLAFLEARAEMIAAMRRRPIFDKLTASAPTGNDQSFWFPDRARFLGELPSLGLEIEPVLRDKEMSYAEYSYLAFASVAALVDEMKSGDESLVVVLEEMVRLQNREDQLMGRPPGNPVWPPFPGLARFSTDAESRAMMCRHLKESEVDLPPLLIETTVAYTIDSLGK